MKKMTSLLAIVFLFMMQVVYGQPNPSNPSQIVANVIYPYMQNNQVPGVAVALYYQGHDYYYNFGVMNKATGQPITQNTIFGIASVTKVFTASLLAVCMQQGRCKLSDPLVNYIPALQNTHNLPIDQVTLQNLVTHTSSLPRDPADFGVINVATPQSYNQLMQDLINWQPNYPIGSHYLYSNLGFGLLGQAMGYAFKTTYINALRQEVLIPLQLNSTFIVAPNNYVSQLAQGYSIQNNPIYPAPITNWPGGGALRSSSADLLTLVKANLGVLPGVPAQLASALQATHQGLFTVGPNMTQALAWQRNMINNILVVNKNGMIPGFSSYIAFLPQQKIAIVVLTNKARVKPGKAAVAIVQALA